MNIIACIKQVPYPDVPASAYGVDTSANTITLPEDVPLVISPYDENAVEAGLQVKDQVGGRLTVVSLATRPAEGVIRDLKQTLAMGADEAIQYCRGRPELAAVLVCPARQGAGFVIRSTGLEEDELRPVDRLP